MIVSLGGRRLHGGGGSAMPPPWKAYIHIHIKIEWLRMATEKIQITSLSATAVPYDVEEVNMNISTGRVKIWWLGYQRIRSPKKNRRDGWIFCCSMDK